VRGVSRIVNALRARLSPRDTAEVERLAETIRTLEREAQDVRRSTARLEALVGSLNSQMEQLRTLRREDAGSGERLARFESVCDPGRIATAVRTAVARAEPARVPFPHVVVPNLLPGEFFAALVDLMPSPEFFEAVPDHRARISIPPVLAPLASVVAWRFFADRVLRDAVAAAVLERLQLPAGSPRVSDAHLLVCRAGVREWRVGEADGGGATLVVCLTQPTAAEGLTAVLHAAGDAGPVPVGGGVPLPPNTAVAFPSDRGSLSLQAAPAGAAGRDACVLVCQAGAAESGRAGEG
jgi:hypothetical protein